LEAGDDHSARQLAHWWYWL